MNINDIARLAHNLKVKKSDIYTALLIAIDNGGTFSDHDLSKLYKYFLPALPAKPKTPEQWVAMAIAKNDPHKHLSYVYSDGKRIIATDGHRAHIFYTNTYTAGFYNRAMVKVHDVDWAKYPDIDKITKGVDFDTELQLSDMPIQSLEMGGRSVPYYLLPGEGRPQGLNCTYLDTALLGGELSMHCCEADPKKPVFLKSTGKPSLRQAFIMPLWAD